MFTRDQLDHLCMLIALDLSSEEKERLLPELDAIIEFVSMLNAYELPETTEADDEQTLPSTTSLPEQGQRTDDFLQSIRHEIIHRMPVLHAGLQRG